MLGFVVSGAALAAVDVTGRWNLPELGEAQIDLLQSATSLFVFYVPNDVPSLAGTIDPDTGVFSADGPGSCGGTDSLIGTATSNTSLSATFTINVPGGIGVFCTPFTTPVTASRTACGDGIVDAGEQCDGGPPGGGDECCSPFSCQFKPDSTLCSIAGPPTDGICLSGACVPSDNPGFPVNAYSLYAQRRPRVDSDAAGNFVVVWENLGERDGDNAGIFARRFQSTGVAIGDDFQINSHTTSAQNGPRRRTRSGRRFHRRLDQLAGRPPGRHRRATV